ncbi:hypothetical protein V0R39_10505 [Pseudomonas inefficax]|nr:hypothetical protein [Pseudomonas inefficax]MEE1907456.1 hypothetical protein [Pseudomonas inefficax]MEE1984920.1 hypothetical protein [Pseudomonas inefficax]
MSLLVRKITRGKWSIGEEVEAVNADAITQCLKTQDNTLSVWQIKDESDINQSILAMAAANEMLSKIDVVMLTEQALHDKNISIDATPGLTPCTNLVGTHRDLSQLNVAHLGVISELIADEIRKGNVKSFTLSTLKNILVDAIKSGELESSSLSESVREKVEKHLKHLEEEAKKKSQ